MSGQIPRMDEPMVEPDLRPTRRWFRYLEELVQQVVGTLLANLSSGKIWIGDSSNLPAEKTVSGDATLASGGALTLANVNSDVGSFGTSTNVSRVTVNAKGLTTAVSSVLIQIPSSQVTDFTEAAQDSVGSMVDTTLVYTDATPFLGRASITGDVSVPVSSNTATLATVNSSIGTFGSSTVVGQFTVSSKGLVTAVSSVAIAIASGQVTNFTEAAQDAIGAMVDLTLVYTDAIPFLGRASITGDVAVPVSSNTATLSTVNSNIGTFGSSTRVGQFTVSSKGLVTAVSSVAIAIPSGSVTDFTEAAQDAVGAMVDLTLIYTDASPFLGRAAITGDVSVPVCGTPPEEPPCCKLPNGAMTAAPHSAV